MDSQESRLREELAAHLEELTTDYEREGMSPRAARRAARLKWRRGLRRSPGYAATVVVSLALAIGANTTVFTEC